MKKYIKIIIFMLITFSPCLVNAQELQNTEEMEVIAETTKYYKTITTRDNLQLNSYSSLTVPNSQSYSVEVSEEEYNQANETKIETRNTGITETTYKKMTTAILQNGSYYRFRNILTWKTMPAIRSYDIIAIGMYSNVRIASTVSYSQYYCFSVGNCVTSMVHTPKIGNNGAGTVFKLMSGSLSTLKITMYFDVEKNTNATITELTAFGDYSHATTPISYENAQNYSVSVGGINLNSSISNYYDSIQFAEARAFINW